MNGQPRAIILGRPGMVGRGRLPAAPFVSLNHPAGAADPPPGIEAAPFRPLHCATNLSGSP